MRVLLNVQSLSPPLTGIGRYTLEILRALSTSASIENLRCFAQWRWVNSEQMLQNTLSGKEPVDALINEPVDRSLFECGLRNSTIERLRRLIRAVPGAYPLRSKVQDLTFLWRASSDKATVYHEPNYVLRPFHGPRVLTVHDISHLRYPAFHPVERVRHLEKRLPRSLQQADQVITVSWFSKNELIDFMGVPQEKITSIPLGVDPACHPRSSVETTPLLRSFGLQHGRYLLVVATMEPRKNLPRLIQAYAELPEAMRNRFPLVIAGASGWGPRLNTNKLAALEIKGQVRCLGYVPDPLLPLLYAGAGAFAFPSLYEGFGLPPLEALASGVPVLTSSTASLPEVVGNAALLINPEDTKDIYRGLHRLLADEDFRLQAVHAGPQQAAGFTWNACVQKTIAVYAKALYQ